ncbi:hypothetical protein ABZU42_03820 [Micromonospora profundi]
MVTAAYRYGWAKASAIRSACATSTGWPDPLPAAIPENSSHH